MNPWSDRVITDQSQLARTENASPAQRSFSRRALPAVLVLAAIPLSASCIIEVDPEEIQRTACEQLESLPEEQLEEFFDIAVRELKKAGIELDARVWSDPDKFTRYLEEFHRATGCADVVDSTAQVEGLGSAKLKLHEGGSTNYCGPGHSNGIVDIAAGRVVACLNDACMVHDSCYAQCSAEAGLSCSWSNGTSPCDDEFFRRADNCNFKSDGFVAWLNSHAIVSLARAIASVPSNCPFECPGSGPCITDRAGLECNECIGAKDPGGECFAHVQSHGKFAFGVSDDAYLANCPTIGGCFGGYGLDSGGGGSGGGGGGGGGGSGIDPGSLWDVYLLDGELAGDNVGSSWDGDGSAPDPYVGVTVGSSGATEAFSSAKQDTYYPSWNQYVVSGATAADIQAYFRVRVFDEDISAHDLAGTCEWLISEEFFDYPLTLSCPQGDGLSGYDVNIYLAPH
jgi:hypothetical protein